MRDASQKRVLNLTQLRRNRRKRPDKTSGRKRPRTADVDVVAAPDAEPEAGTSCVQPLNDVEPEDETNNVVIIATPTPTPPAQPQPAIRSDICHACDSVEPVPRKNKRNVKTVRWVQCDTCPRWYHTVCVGVRNTAAAFVCELCED